MSDFDVVEFCLDDGTLVLASAIEVESDAPADAGRRGSLSFSHVSASIRGLAGELHKALQAAKPDVVVVELGFDLAVKGSQLLALIADAGTQASVKVRLEWHGDSGGSVAKSILGGEDDADEADADEADADDSSPDES